MTAPLPNGTRVLITWPKSTYCGKEAVIVGQVGDRSRIEVNGGGVFLKVGEFEVITPADARNGS